VLCKQVNLIGSMVIFCLLTDMHQMSYVLKSTIALDVLVNMT